MAELVCAQCLPQPCWLSVASAVDSTGLTQAEVGPQLQVNLPEPMCSGRSLCLSRLNMSVPSQAEDVWKHAERSEGMLSHIEAKGLAQTC